MLLLLSWLACLLPVPTLMSKFPGLSGCNGVALCNNSHLSVQLGMSDEEISDGQRTSDCGARGQCRYLVWTQWSVCTCHSRLRSRVARSVGSRCSTRVCPSRAVQTQECSGYATVYCKLSEWTSWSTCTAGAEKRWRAVIQPETCKDRIQLSCFNNLIQTRFCQSENKIKRSLFQESELNSTGTSSPDRGDSDESEKGWWIYLIVAVVCTALLLFSISFTVHYIRHRRGRYVVKSSERTARVCDQGEAGLQDASSSTHSLKLKPLQSCMKQKQRKQRRSSGNESRGSSVNFAVGSNDSSNSSASSEAGDGPLKDGRYGITNPMVNVEAEETLKCKEHSPNRKRHTTYDSQASGEQLVWYFDDDDRSSVMQSNTEDREDLEEYVLEKSGAGHGYNNPLCALSDPNPHAHLDLSVSTRLTGDGTSDSSVLEEEDRDSVLSDMKQSCYGRGSMPPADGNSEPSSPGGQGSYQPISRGHGIWQYGREVTPDGKRYTKIKVTKLHLPSGQSNLASDV